MSNDVCESWEDILKEEVCFNIKDLPSKKYCQFNFHVYLTFCLSIAKNLNKQVENLKLNASENINGSVSPASVREMTQCNGNSIKIMKRNKKSTKQVIDLDTLVAMCDPLSSTTNGVGYNSNGFPKSQSDLSNFVNSEPFVPQSNRSVHVSFEDNSRTLFLAQNQGSKLPQVKILQRPKTDASSQNSAQNSLNKNG